MLEGAAAQRTPAAPVVSKARGPPAAAVKVTDAWEERMRRGRKEVESLSPNPWTKTVKPA